MALMIGQATAALGAMVTALAGPALVLVPVAPSRATPLTAPVVVPLHWVAKPGDPTSRKLGIYAAINNGSTPELFEFDTGGTGFLATAACDPAKSPWWGGASPPSPCSSQPPPAGCPTPSLSTFCTIYDSGLQYNGNIVSSTVQLFAAQSGPVALSTPSLTMGQTLFITGGSAKSDPSGWLADDPDGSNSFRPPVQGRFYGDFGLSIKPSASGIPSLIQQDSFWAQFDPDTVKQGVRVHASDDTPWVQFGLTQQDLSGLTLRFDLDPSYGGIRTGSLSVQKAGANGNQPFAMPMTTLLIFDTGATTTIHSGPVLITGQSDPNGVFPCALTNAATCPFPSDPPVTTVLDKADVLVRALSSEPGVGEVELLRFLAGDNTTTTRHFNQVTIQGLAPPPPLSPACEAVGQNCYYLNTGILPFLQYDVITILHPESQQIALVQPSVPAPAAGLALASACGWSRRLRRRLRPRPAATRSQP